jgi:hypothetical protein
MRCFSAARFAVVISSLAITACAPKVNLAPGFAERAPRTVAFLGVQSKGINRPETVDYLASALRSELASRGYLVLDPRVVEAICKQPGCSDSERKELERRGAQAFAGLMVDAQSENNFGFGYYNTVAGTLRITDASLRELGSVSHQQSERGGLIFSSGQVFQGLQDSVENIEARNRNYLSDEFIRKLVGQLPRPASDVAQSDAVPTISQVSIKTVRSPVTEICVTSAPGLAASLLVDRRRTPLREVAAGRYCGNYVFAGGLSIPSRVQLEVKTQFGNAARQDVALPSVASCDFQSRVRVVPVQGARRIEVQCGQPDPGACSNPLGECGVSRLLVYRAVRPAGPFLSIGQTTKAVWVDDKAPKGSDAYYQVVAVNSNGTRSLPITPAADK